MLDDFTKHQQRIIKGYYRNQDAIQKQRLAELVGELFLAEGKKRQTVWKRIATALQKIGVPQAQIDHLQAKDDASILAAIVNDMEGR